MRSGTNLPRVKDYNQGVILEAIRSDEGISRTELATKTGLTKQTVSVIVKRLLDQQLVREDGIRASSGGKRATNLRLERTARYTIGVQLDVDYTNLVVMALDGKVVAESYHNISTILTPYEVISKLAEWIKELVIESALNNDKIIGVGVCAPGPLNYFKGIIHNPPALKVWIDIPLKQLLEVQTGYHVIVDNDATAAAIGERWSGGAQGVNNFAFIYMGTGIGGGLFIENQVYRGSTTYAGEFGHMSLNPYGAPCFCGNRGCIEVCCAPPAIVDVIHARLANGEPSILTELYNTDPVKVDFEEIGEAALSGDPLALQEIERVAWLLGNGVVNLVNLLDVSLVVLGGKGFRKLGTLYQRIIQEVLDQRVIARSRRDIRVELSAAGENAGAVGAASLILHEFFAPRLASLNPT
ncbi:MAG: ROK family transcriptional regulator [Chloroflexi bacterium]|uniref:ROK family transcriptional regulator n=1 Tax=Candidatus Chlorohelix allophototropha TaxID=3003348 RepID=A0A8T7LTT0_9CHLR|nr:ROK family transcriptional regulator [Chloroflexota bacterium]WJW66178.1 ROK family transcriptional regulator [Chloroflexota bacterium L227-S17]